MGPTRRSVVTASAGGLGGCPFAPGASGNIAVNIAAGNNNAQRNSLAASVSVAGYAQASVASDQVSTGNVTNNTGMTEMVRGTDQISFTGTVSGVAGSRATYDETGMSYQHRNMYPSTWGADSNDGNHNSTPRLGHVDFDIDSQGATPNPVRADEIDEASVRKAKEEAERVLAGRGEAMEIAEAQQRMAEVAAQLQALERLRKNLKH